MRIGFFTDRFYPQVDGVAVSVDLFARELRKLGHEVFIFCPQGTPKQKNEPDYIIRFRSFPSIWYEDYRDTLPFTPAIIRRVKACKLDLVHFHTPAMVGFLGVRIAREEGLPIVTTHHTDIEQYVQVYKRIMAGFLAGIFVAPALMRSPDSYRSSLRGLKPQRSIRKWNKQIVREALKGLYDTCQLVIAPSEKMKNLLGLYNINTKTVVLPTGIDPQELLLPTSFNPRKEYGIDPKTPLLLYVGRLGEEKNIQRIIKALPYIIEKRPNTQLMIVGDGPYAAELADLAEQMGLKNHVIFTGMLDRPRTFACFKSADVFVFASTTDTQGLVINEAGLAGKPIVFVDDQISPVTIDGKTGIKAPSTARGIATAVNKLLANPKLMAQYGQAAQTAAKTITIAKQTQKLVDLYKSLL